MEKRNIAWKGFLILMVLFCAYMQWSPVVDLDYVWINGHEHYVGAANPHQMGNLVMPSLVRPVSDHLEEFATYLPPFAVEQSMALVPATTLRL